MSLTLDSNDTPKPAAKPDLLASASLAIALISVSFAPIFIRFSEEEIGAGATSFNRFFIFALAFGMGRAIASGVGWLRRSPAASAPVAAPVSSLREGMLLFGVGLASTLSLALWAMSLESTSVAKSVLLNNLTPVFASLGGWLFFGKRFDRRFLAGMAIALTGAVFMGASDLFGTTGDSVVGDALALVSAVFLATYFLLAEQLRDRFSATTILLWRNAIGCALLLPFVLLTEERLFAVSWHGWLAVIGLGLICEGMGQRLLAASLNRLSSGFVCLFLLLEPIVSAVLAWFIFAERLALSGWVAFAIVLVGIYLAKSSRSTLHEATPVAVPLPIKEGETRDRRESLGNPGSAMPATSNR